MFFRFLLGVAIAVTTVQNAQGKLDKPFVTDPEIALPEYFKVCPRNSPDLNKCLKDVVEGIILALGNGIPEFGYPAMNPYIFDNMSVDYNQNSIRGKLSVKNVMMRGGNDVKIKSIKCEVTDTTMNLVMKVFNPLIEMEGYYKGAGSFNAIQMHSKGYFNASMYNILTEHKLTGNVVERNGEEYMKITEASMRPDVGDMKIYIDGLFPNNEELNKVALDFTNQYWRVIYEELLPFVEPIWDETMVDLSNRVFLNVPFRRLFPKK